MSRVGRLPISIPSGVTVSIGDGSVGVKGSRGEAEIAIPEQLTVDQADKQVVVKRTGDSRQERSLHGLFRVLIANAVTGVSQGFTRVLQINGVGFRAELRGDTILFNLGFSHPILFQLPDGVKAKIDKQTLITLDGPDRQVLGQAAAQIRELRPPEPYKGKGIKYAEERVRRKAGKAGAAS
jgi:large subunit ribosomal protein L6